MIGKCPVCEVALRVTELSCPSCKTKIVGDLPTCEFCNLDADSLRFLRAFLIARGNIKEVERELGISYPTVRKRLDDLLGILGLEPGVRLTSEEKIEVLGKLEAGELSVENALRILKGQPMEADNAG